MLVSDTLLFLKQPSLFYQLVPFYGEFPTPPPPHPFWENLENSNPSFIKTEEGSNYEVVGKTLTRQVNNDTYMLKSTGKNNNSSLVSELDIS